MEKTIFADMAQRLLGPGGRMWPEYGTLDTLWCRGIYTDYYRNHHYAAESSCARYCAGHSKLPRPLQRRYTLPDGLQQLRHNMQHVVAASTSLARVRRIQMDVHGWVDTLMLLDTDKTQIEANYVAMDATRDQIAAYLADVLHWVTLAS